ncbi:uncharacterized protein LOC125485972 [Rhincodon typus]|uniref:uncharacterized protein LOC125485972 n=1 Tax=Rhincodon typus TaxID=259920 RepID=UPI00202E3EE9|nr:uncharacterized protein LOC125485972 [Rhincodon typus]
MVRSLEMWLSSKICAEIRKSLKQMLMKFCLYLKQTGMLKTDSDDTAVRISEIQELSFILLFSAIHCVPLPLRENVCTLAENLEPQKLLIDLTEYLGFNSEQLNENNQRPTILRLDDVDSMYKTGHLEEFYKAFQRLKLYFSMLSVDNKQLRNELKFHGRQIVTIVHELSMSLDTTPPSVSSPNTQIESEYDKKKFSYEIVKLYVMQLDELKKRLCFEKSH